MMLDDLKFTTGDYILIGFCVAFACVLLIPSVLL